MRELLQLLERLALLLRQFLRNVHAQAGDQVALPAAVQLRSTVAADAQLAAVLRAGGNLQRYAVAVRRRHLDRRAERGFRVRDGNLDDQIRAAPLELLRRVDPRHDIEVARRPTAFTDLALALEADSRAVLHACRNLHRVVLRAPLATCARALLARLLDDRPVPAAARTRLRQREQTLALRDDAATVALRADHR